MTEIMKSHFVTVFLCKFFQALRDRLVMRRNNEIGFILMGYCKNQFFQIVRDYQLPRGLVSFIQFTNNIVAADPEFASSDCENIIFQILKLQSANLTDSQRKPE